MSLPDNTIPERPLYMLLQIKHKLMLDNDLSLKVSGCGCVVAANHIDSLIKACIAMETRCHDLFRQYNYAAEENAAYNKLLDGLTPDLLTDAEYAEIQAIAQRINAENAEKEDDDGK